MDLPLKASFFCGVLGKNYVTTLSFEYYLVQSQKSLFSQSLQWVCNHSEKAGTFVKNHSTLENTTYYDGIFYQQTAQRLLTGHRPEKLTRSEADIQRDLETEIRQAITDGITAFISGMARGIAVYNGAPGGTRNTIAYAKSLNVPVTQIPG